MIEFDKASYRDEVVLPSHKSYSKLMDKAIVDVTEKYLGEELYIPPGCDTMYLSKDDDGYVFVAAAINDDESTSYSLSDIEEAFRKTFTGSLDIPFCWERLRKKLQTGSKPNIG